MRKIGKIISGGQTGADQGGLFAGEFCKIETGGWAPKGWRTQKGPAPWLERYGLRETQVPSYPVRTEFNVRDCDITIVFGDPNSPGCKLTRRLCGGYERDIKLVRNFDDRDFVNCYRHIMEDMPYELIVNVAGNREESFPGIEAKTKAFMIRLIEAVNRDND